MIDKIWGKLVLRFGNMRQRVKYLQNQGVNIGDNCEILRNVSFGTEPYLITLGNYVKITNGTKLLTHDGGMYVLRNLKLLENADKFGTIVIGNNVFIGNNVLILPGVTIGDNVVVGAGTIVTKDIPSNCVAIGVPCKVIQSIEEYYQKNIGKVDYTKGLSYREKKAYIMNKLT